VGQVSNWFSRGFARTSLLSVNEKHYGFRIESQQGPALPLLLQQSPVEIQESRSEHGVLSVALISIAVLDAELFVLNLSPSQFSYK